MDFSKLFSASYLFDSTPGDLMRFMPILIAFFLALILASIGIDRWLKSYPHKKQFYAVIPNLNSRLRTLGIIGFLFLWVRYENLIYLSMRFLLFAYILGIFVYLGHSLYQFKKVLPLKIASDAKRKNQKSYLPKKKRKRKI